MTDGAATAIEPPRRRRWPRVLLVASLALNALLIGIIIRGLWGLRTELAMRGAGLPAFVATLPADRREKLREVAPAAPQGSLRALRGELRRARLDAYRAFTADPFDKAAFTAAQKRLFDLEAEVRLSAQRMLPEIGERMTPEERRAYMRWRGAEPGGFRRGGGQHGPRWQGGPNGEGGGSGSRL